MVLGMMTSGKQQIQLRKATRADLPFCWKLAHDPDVQVAFFSPCADYPHYKAEFLRRLTHPAYHVFIIQAGNRKVGRMEVSGQHHEAELSYAIAPRFRRQGMMTEALVLLLQHNSMREIETFVAEVKYENTASLDLLLKRGFKAVGCRLELSR